MRFFSSIALCALLAASNSPSQTSLEVARGRANLERRSAFLELWEESDSRRKDAAIRIFKSHRAGAERRSALPRIEALTEAWRVLARPEDSGEPLRHAQRFADSLDVRVVPGIYPGRPDGKPEPLTVRINQLYHVPLEHAVEVSLFWIGADGNEVRARTEPVMPLAFRKDGFVMYVTAPSVIPGTWSLVVEISIHGEKARGRPIPVYGIDALEEILQTLTPDVRREIDALLETGLRPAFPRAFLEEVGLVSTSDTDRWSGARSGTASHELLREFGGGTLWHVGVSKREPRRVVLFMPPREEDPRAVFVGPVGEAWTEFARSHEAWLISSDLPLRSAGARSLMSIAGTLRERLPETEIFLVARGGALLDVALAFLDGTESPFDGLLLSLALASDKAPRNLPDVRGLAVVSEASKRLPRESLGNQTDWDWVRRTEPWILTDLELPELFSEWLAN